jgi:hypothetical protein
LQVEASVDGVVELESLPPHAASISETHRSAPVSSALPGTDKWGMVVVVSEKRLNGGWTAGRTVPNRKQAPKTYENLRVIFCNQMKCLERPVKSDSKNAVALAVLAPSAGFVAP